LLFFYHQKHFQKMKVKSLPKFFLSGLFVSALSSIFFFNLNASTQKPSASAEKQGYGTVFQSASSNSETLKKDKDNSANQSCDKTKSDKCGIKDKPK